MKSMYAGVVIALSSLFIVGVASTAAAQETAAGGYKIAVVDVQKVLRDYNKRIQKYNQLQAEVENLQKEIDALSAKVESGRQNMNTRRQAGAEDSELITIETQIRTDMAAYQSKLAEHQAKIDGMEKQVLQEVIGDVEAAINGVGQSQNYHLILNAREGSAGSVVYHSSTLDITAAVLAQLNEGAAPAAAAPAEDGKKKKKD